MTKKRDDFEGVVRYVAPALPSMPKLPAGLRVRVLVDRADGANLSEEELAAAHAAFPLPGDAPAAQQASSTTKPAPQPSSKKPAATKPAPEAAAPAKKRRAA